VNRAEDSAGARYIVTIVGSCFTLATALRNTSAIMDLQMRVRMKTPRRIQRKRSKGWTMPEGAVYVGRPTGWGNPWRVGVDGTAAECVEKFKAMWLKSDAQTIRTMTSSLRGKDLACWCRLTEKCHADILLEIANHENT